MERRAKGRSRGRVGVDLPGSGRWSLRVSARGEVLLETAVRRPDRRAPAASRGRDDGFDAMLASLGLEGRRPPEDRILKSA